MTDRIEVQQLSIEPRLPRAAAATIFMCGSSGIAIIDTVAVERAVAGHLHGARLTNDEAYYAASVLLDAGAELHQVADMVGTDLIRLRRWFSLSEPTRKPHRACESTENVSAVAA
ncbi:hypothetical protein GT043_13090 [Streptomyces sp. SID2131]|nr:hypothetical protein [Streptomyces sp. SID2131]